MPASIEDYALIGDCETAALVSRDGSIDWLCWPRFDSDACFAALLGTPQNGRWLVAPTAPDAHIERRYQEGTLILETDFETEDGAVTVVDFMPPRGSYSDLVRLVIGKRGKVRMHTEFVLRFGYGETVPWVTRLEDGTLRAVAGPDMVALRTPAPLEPKGLTTVAEFTVSEGETVPFTLTYAPSNHPLPPKIDETTALDDTVSFWRDWLKQCTYQGEWEEPVLRSLITLKALTYRPTGGIVAAPTTSLPEQIGGTRNWDYRFCWLRDATLTLLALMDAGYYDEAGEWRDWLLRAAAGSPSQVQIMYGLAGERRLQEWEVPWLPGYEGSTPVRIGNAAHGQLQLDVYGEVMDALHQARHGGLKRSLDAWHFQCALVHHLGTVWEQPDRGIWEVRGPPQQFTHSKVMAWVAVDRAIKDADAFDLECPHDEWCELRDRIHEDVCSKGYNEELGCFVQSYGSTLLDASLLMIPLVGFLPADDPRVRGTIACIEKRLMSNGFVMRYDTGGTDDGLPPGEGAFLACSFWFVDCLVLVGRQSDARKLFSRLLSLRNDLGLLAEEYDPRLRRLVGNFPQAFSHVALVDSALNLGRRDRRATPRPAEQRAHSKAKE